MEGKTVILSVLIMSLVMAQIQVEAQGTVCCPSTTARRIYNTCRLPLRLCLERSGCIMVPGKLRCPPHYPHDNLENTGDAVNEYCKLGCASSVCGAMEAIQNSDGSEIVNGAVEECAKACSTFCTKGSTAVVGTA